MAHTICLGITGSWKTHFAAYLVRELKKLGGLVIVYTPIVGETRWAAAGADIIVHDREQFLRLVRDPKTRGCHVVIDEIGRTIRRYDLEMQDLATDSRNAGHSLFLIGQSATTVNKEVRRQCEHLICFYQDMDDCIPLAKQFSEPTLLLAWKLRPGEYIRKRRFSKATFGRVAK